MNDRQQEKISSEANGAEQACARTAPSPRSAPHPRGRGRPGADGDQHHRLPAGRRPPKNQILDFLTCALRCVPA